MFELVQPAGGRETPVEEISVSDASSFSNNSLGYHNAGTPTASGDGTAIHFIVIGRDTTNNKLQIIYLQDGDILKGDYEGATTSLAVGDYVDLNSSVICDATDETEGSDGRLMVLGIDDPTSGKLRLKFHHLA